MIDTNFHFILTPDRSSIWNWPCIRLYVTTNPWEVNILGPSPCHWSVWKHLFISTITCWCNCNSSALMKSQPDWVRHGTAFKWRLLVILLLLKTLPVLSVYFLSSRIVGEWMQRKNTKICMINVLDVQGIKYSDYDVKVPRHFPHIPWTPTSNTALTVHGPAKNLRSEDFLPGVLVPKQNQIKPNIKKLDLHLH